MRKVSLTRSVVGACIAGCLAILVSGGCGDGKPRRVPVAGRVLIDGQPLTLGSISFVPAESRPSGSAIDGEGRFNLSCYERGDGAVLGEHRVCVTAAEQLSETAIRWHAPKKYAELETSGLEVTVDGPTDDVVIELSWNGGKPFVERDGG